MNPQLVKENLKAHLGNDMIIKVYGMRNKIETYEGKLYKLYPNFFTVIYRGEEKSFNYRDIITKDVKIKFLNY